MIELFVFIFNHAVIAVVQSLRIYESFGRLQELQMLNSWWIRKYFWTNWRSIHTNDNYAIHKKLETATVCQYRSSSGSVTVSSYKMIGVPPLSYFSRNLLMHEEISPWTVTASSFKQTFTVWWELFQPVLHSEAGAQSETACLSAHEREFICPRWHISGLIVSKSPWAGSCLYEVEDNGAAGSSDYPSTILPGCHLQNQPIVTFSWSLNDGQRDLSNLSGIIFIADSSDRNQWGLHASRG